MSSESDSPRAITIDWLAKFDAAVSTGDVKATTALFLDQGWLRDVLVFTWAHRSLCGRDAISTYLSESDNLGRANIQNVKLDCRHGISPALVEQPGSPPLVEAAFTFENPISYGRGFVRLLQIGQEWAALACYVQMDDLKGHEEKGAESGTYEEHTKMWQEVHAERRACIEKDPHVIIIGAAQSGLNVGARFRQMNIPTLLIDREGAVGDNWRHRYPTLTLHTPKAHASLLYQQYPRNWPRYTPRDKLADWMEHYARDQDLVVWTKSTVVPTPSYDPYSKRWTVTINRNGESVTLHPYHIVAAMGINSDPFIPDIPGQWDFKGEVCHTSAFKGGKPYAGKKAVVIGAGNSAVDICQDLVACCAASVTLVQRSRTVVVKKEVVSSMLDATYNTHEDSLTGDFRFESLPQGLTFKILAGQKEARVAEQKEMLDGLRKAGMELYEGPYDAGFFPLLSGRGGGYWFDVGAADMIIDGRIKVKQGTEPYSFNEKGLLFKDGSTVEADLVVLATGWNSVVDQVRTIFGEEVAKRTSPVWGLNEEFERRNVYVPSGQPGFWYALGDFSVSRFYSKTLALQIKAREIGLVHD